MTKDEAVEAFRVLVHKQYLDAIPENANTSMRETAEVSGELYARMSADHFEHHFELYESIFKNYLA